jgi:hypothetical protein
LHLTRGGKTLQKKITEKFAAQKKWGEHEPRPPGFRLL